MTYIDDHIDQLDIPAALNVVSEERRRYAESFRSPQRQRECLAAYLLLQKALRLEYGIDEPVQFIRGQHGKPTLAGHHNIHFSLSHCRDAVACIVSNHPVGIDIERMGRYSTSLLDYTMNSVEKQQITASSNPDISFIRLWTMKEALLKLTGAGLTEDLQDVLRDTDQYCFNTSVFPTYICTTCEII